MKTAKEWSDDITKLWSKFDWDEINFNQFKNYVKNYIEQAQKEAYNQAIEDAAKSAVAYDTVPRVYSSCVVDKQSILKLKK